MGKYLEELYNDFNIHRRMLLDELISKLTDGQREKLHKVYPTFVDEQLDQMIDLCERTIRRNERDEHNP